MLSHLAALRSSILLAASLATASLATASLAEDPSRQDVAGTVADAKRTMRRAATYFREKVATEGGYLWAYSEDLSKREGERRATATQAWVQPPGTPAVGEAFLTAYEATREEYYLDAARETATALVRGQLQSGGWDYRIEFDPAKRTQYAYRSDQREQGRNVTTLDDDTTQSATRFLIHFLRVRDDESIRQAAGFALRSLRKAQFPNGAWPQRYQEFPDPKRFPVMKARFPDSWPRQHPRESYHGFYTLNDNVMSDMIEMMFDASASLDDSDCRTAAIHGGEFLLLAQMPEPQPAWAQQYDLEMQPTWARKFEPPAVSGGESQAVMRTLLTLYQQTKDEKFLEPLPRAVEYFRRSRLRDGRLARFYELKTNRPLYFTKEYVLTHRDDDLPTHYSFRVSNGVERIARDLQAIKQQGDRNSRSKTPRLTASLVERAEQIIAGLDDQGRWLDKKPLKNFPLAAGEHVVSCRVFINNMKTLSEFLIAAR
ncbi:MAG: pectate lyase [Planctomycetales bacterium]